jgi:putative tricarboxylic transport membrane protein
MSTFVAYAAEKGIARDRSQFGKGDPRGLCAPEAADNGSVGGALIPTLSLGIPGSAAGALILGGLIMAGLQPGPLLFQNSSDIVWTVIAAVLVANVLLLVMNTLLVPLFASAIQVLDPYLTAVISGLCVVGVYSLRNSAFDVLMMAMFGVVGYAMRLSRYPLASLLLGVILGPMLEQNFRQALLTSRGDYSTFWGSPITATLLALSVLLVAFFVVRGVVRERRRRRTRQAPSSSDHPGQDAPSDSASDTMEEVGRNV